MPAGMWCEARCQFFDAAGTDECGRPACLQTAPGGFGTQLAHKRARQAGWILRDSKWCCPACDAALRK